jgi:predicted Na+-dependent transporter
VEKSAFGSVAFVKSMERILKYARIILIILACCVLLIAGFAESALIHQRYTLKGEFSEWEHAGKPRGADLVSYASTRKTQTTYAVEFGELTGFNSNKRVVIVINMGRRVVGIEGIGTFIEK